MNRERYQELLDNPGRTQAELVTMRENALRMNDLGCMHMAESALNHRFPNWRSPASRRGGPKPTDVEFLGRREQFHSEKDAYVWLLERLIQRYPQPFSQPGPETLFLAKGGHGALYFAKSLRGLFGEQHQDLAADPNKWCRLSNGWYAKLVLSEQQKLRLLNAYATLAGLQFGVDWDWNSRGRAKPQVTADDLLRELENLLSLALSAYGRS